MGGRTSAESINRYMAKVYDRINLTVPKGDKEIIKSAADKAGISVNAYIYKAIQERMVKDGIITE